MTAAVGGAQGGGRGSQHLAQQVFDKWPHPQTELFLASILLSLGCSATQEAHAIASTYRTLVGEL
jgi:hypothetical protein